MTPRRVDDHRLILLVLLLAAVGGCSTVGRDVTGIHNFGKVSADPITLYRGAQPDRAGIQALHALGVQTIINLRDGAQAWEPHAVRSAGMNYIEVPLSASDFDDDQVIHAVQTLLDAEPPVFVHCRVGRDRTGMIVAAYRMAACGYTPEQALAELRAYGHYRLLYPGIDRYIETRDPARLRGRVVSPER